MGGLTLWERQGLAFHQQCIPLQRLLRKKQLWFSQHSLHHLERTHLGDPSDIVRMFETHSIVTTKGWNLLFLLCPLPRSQELIYFLLWYYSFSLTLKNVTKSQEREEMASKPHAIGDPTQTVTLEESLNLKKLKFRKLNMFTVLHCKYKLIAITC